MVQALLRRQFRIPATQLFRHVVGPKQFFADGRAVAALCVAAFQYLGSACASRAGERAFAFTNFYHARKGSEPTSKKMNASLRIIVCDAFLQPAHCRMRKSRHNYFGTYTAYPRGAAQRSTQPESLVHLSCGRARSSRPRHAKGTNCVLCHFV